MYCPPEVVEHDGVVLGVKLGELLPNERQRLAVEDAVPKRVAETSGVSTVCERGGEHNRALSDEYTVVPGWSPVKYA